MFEDTEYLKLVEEDFNKAKNRVYETLYNPYYGGLQRCLPELNYLSSILSNGNEESWGVANSRDCLSEVKDIFRKYENRQRPGIGSEQEIERAKQRLFLVRFPDSFNSKPGRLYAQK